MKTGLVSISFRKKSIKELIKAAKESGLEYIEWGGDVHIPMGNVKLARKVKRLMNGAGLKCETYGSYFGMIYHCDEHFPMPFKKVLKTARALGAKPFVFGSVGPVVAASLARVFTFAKSNLIKTFQLLSIFVMKQKNSV